MSQKICSQGTQKFFVNSPMTLNKLLCLSGSSAVQNDCPMRVCCGQDLKSVSLVKVIIDLESHTGRHTAAHKSNALSFYTVPMCKLVDVHGFHLLPCRLDFIFRKEQSGLWFCRKMSPREVLRSGLAEKLALG